MDSYDLMLTTLIVLSASYSMTLFIVIYLIWWIIRLRREREYREESPILPFSQEVDSGKTKSRTMWDSK